jgi:hypothetical protein
MGARSSGIADFCFSFALSVILPGFHSEIRHFMPHGDGFTQDPVQTVCHRIMENCDGYPDRLIRIAAIAIRGDRHTNPAHEKSFKTCELIRPAKTRPDIAESPEGRMGE